MNASMPSTHPPRESAVSARSFDLLRTGAQSWVMDTAGLWSYPAILPGDQAKSYWLMLISGTVPMPEKKRSAVFRPKAVVVSRACRPAVVRYENFHEGHDPFPTQGWDKPLAMFPHKAIGGLSVSQFRKEEAELLAMYPMAIEALNSKAGLPKGFISAYLKLTHPMFLPYLRHLAPIFFDALNIASVGPAPM
jgi:hypothetical protein